MNIGIDMMGGDFAPLEAVKGLKLYFEEVLSSKLLVVSSEEKKNPQLTTNNLQPITFTLDRKSTRLNSSHVSESRMPSSA